MFDHERFTAVNHLSRSSCRDCEMDASNYRDNIGFIFNDSLCDVLCWLILSSSFEHITSGVVVCVVNVLCLLTKDLMFKC